MTACDNEAKKSSESDLKRRLEAILRGDPLISQLLEVSGRIGKAAYCIGAGCIVQTVWNHLYQRPQGFGIHDIDWVYFDADGSSAEEELAIAAQLKVNLDGCTLPIDVKNQALVHQWYESRFNTAIAPYNSLEHAIDSWPTTATAIGVWLDSAGQFQCYAPFGLTDLFSGIVRPNPVQVPREVFEKKAERWQTLWPDLEVIPWQSYRLKPATLRDAEWIYELKRITLKPHIELIWGWDEADQQRRFKKEFNPETHWLIEWHGRDIGILELNEDNRTLNVVELEIHPKYQGKGMGSVILRDLKLQSLDKKKNLALGCFKVNEGALRFYKSLGMKVVEETETHFLFSGFFY